MTLLPRITTPKHQKLILQCYPGKSSEMKPNNAELSRLLYYATTRRTKLEKVCVFLEKKMNSDSSRGRTGHSKVTLYILMELIKQCSDDIGVYALNVINVIKSSLAPHDLAVCQLAAEAYELFCEKVPKITVFAGNATATSAFVQLSSAFVDFGTNPLKPNEQEWSILSLKVISCFASSINSNLMSPLFDRSMAIIISNVSQSSNRDLVLSKLATHLSGDNESLRRTRTSVVSVDLAKYPVEDASIAALKSFFDTTSKGQVNLATRSFCRSAVRQHDESFYGPLIEVCVNRTHIELRYYVVTSLLDELMNSHSESACIKIAEMMSHLLTSDVSMIGLPVKNLENSIMKLQEDAIIDSHLSLLKSYSDVIKSISAHIYYSDQINDMIKEIFIRYLEIYDTIKYNATSPVKTEFTADKFKSLTLCFVDNVRGILFVTGHDRLSNLKRLPYPHDLWTLLFYCINFEGNYFTPEDKADIQLVWLQLYQEFLLFEKDNSASFESDCKDNDSLKTKSENPLNQYYTLIHKVMQSSNISLKQIIVGITEIFVTINGITALISYIPFALKSSQLEPTDFRHSYSLYALYVYGKCLGINSLERSALSKIQACKEAGCWSELISVQDNESSGGVLSFERSDLLACISQDPRVQNMIVIDDSNLDDHYGGIPSPTSRHGRRAMTPFAAASIANSLNGNANGGASPFLHSTGSLISHTSNGIIDFQRPVDIASGGNSINHDMRSISSFNAARSIASKISNSPGAKDLRAVLSNSLVDKRIPSNVTSNGLSKVTSGIDSIVEAKSATNKKSSLAVCISNLDLSDDEN